SWNETQLIYILNQNEIISNITGFIRQWNSQSVITFHLDNNDKTLMNNKLLDKNQVRTIFSSFNIEQIIQNDNRGVMMGFAGQYAGIWNSSSEIIRNSLEGGPVVLFNLNKKKGKKTGSTYKSSPMELLSEREIIIAILSTGPVGLGDVINYTDSTRIMKYCRQDGLILKPDRSITMINLLISA
ncbi:unnamed protein product, partial [Rotaria sp. Silwood2]